MKKILLFSMLVLAPSVASAATVSVIFTPQSVGVGDHVEVTLAIESNQIVNAFSGNLRCSPALSFVSAGDGNSIVTAWITSPAESSGGIGFAGITAGGFSGNGGTLFSAIYTATAAGVVTCTPTDMKVLEDDGAGDPANVTLSDASLTVGAQSTGDYVAPVSATPPEAFTIYTAQEPGLYDGKTYLTFAAVDKGTGIADYQAAESRFPAWLVPLKWQVTGTVYVPQDQWGTSDVYIRAVDRDGNVRTEVFPRAHLLRPYEEDILGGMVILLFLICCFRLVTRRFAR